MSERVRELTRLLHLSASYRDPNPERSHITGLTHALRVGALAGRISDELALIGLVHDLARPLTDVGHGEAIAEIVRDRVTDLSYYVLRTHGIYQASVIRQTSWRPMASPTEYRTAYRFAAYEEASFAVDYTGPALTIAEGRALLEKWLS